jgi:hypothetical protein
VDVKLSTEPNQPDAEAFSGFSHWSNAMTSRTAKTSAKPAADATKRDEVESVQTIQPGKVAVVTLRDWLPESGMAALRSQLQAATGHAPVILPPGATIKTMTPKAVETALAKAEPEHQAAASESASAG